MITNYEFKNFKSFKNTANVSMIANSHKEHLDKLIKYKNNYISSTKIVYGGNSSGKTSFIQAIKFIQTFARRSNNLVGDSNIGVTPFKFIDNAETYPSEFSITFIKDELKYAYSFSCTYETVIDEKLDVYYSVKPTNIFTRKNTNEYTFNSDAKELNIIKERNTPNKLFLVTAATWNYTKLNPVIDYIFNDIVVLFDVNQAHKYNLDAIVNNGHFEEYKEFCLEFLNSADLNISDFEVNSKKISELGKGAEVMRDLFKLLNKDSVEKVERFEKSNVYNIKTKHSFMRNGTENIYELELMEESLGTIQMFNMTQALFYIFKEGKTLFIDELDRSLHPLIVKYIVRKFLDRDFNVKNAQLICNTHDTNLLDLELMRRDDILFVDKDYKTGISELYSLADFSVRKADNIEKAYLLGRYGAIPFLKEDL